MVAWSISVAGSNLLTVNGDDATCGVLGYRLVDLGAHSAFTGSGLDPRRFRGADYHSGRVSLWRFPGPSQIDVRYEDGRPFHGFLVEAPQAEHLCGDDRYRVSYDFGPDTWLSRWEVDGPAKDYARTTRYRRVGKR